MKSSFQYYVRRIYIRILHRSVKNTNNYISRNYVFVEVQFVNTNFRTRNIIIFRNSRIESVHDMLNILIYSYLHHKFRVDYLLNKKMKDALPLQNDALIVLKYRYILDSHIFLFVN